MNVLATGDVDPSVLAAFRDELGPDLPVVLDEHSIMLKSLEAPSWVQFLAEAPWWVQFLATYAAIYVGEIAKEAGKETWKDRAKLAADALSGVNRLAKLASAFANLRAQLPERTGLVIGLPIPDDYFGVRFELQGRDEDVLAAEIALFVRHVPGIEALVDAEGLRHGRVTGALKLTLLQNGSMSVRWMDRKSLTMIERVLPLPDET